MILSEKINKVPDVVYERLSDWAKRDMKLSGPTVKYLMDKSVDMWILSDEDGEPLLVAGVQKFSLVGQPPTLWLVTCQAFHERRGVRMELLSKCSRLAAHLRVLYPDLQAVVHPEHKVGQRFAEQFGFIHDGAEDGWLVYKGIN